MNSKIPWMIVATSIVGSLILAVLFWSKLPDEVASHFGAGGQPDDWMSKEIFVAFMLVLQVGLAGMMCGIGWLVRVLPPSMINIPNREYWLSEDRKEETVRDISMLLAWIAAATSIFMMMVFWLTIDANVNENKQLDTSTMWLSLTVYLVWLFGYLIFKMQKYFRVPTSNA